MNLVARAVGSIIGKLGELLQAEYKLQKGLPEQIESLKKELECAQTAVLTVRELPPEQLDPQVRLWAREVREASYDMEDILDAFLVDVEEGAAPAMTESMDGLCKQMAKLSMKLLKKSEARHDIAGAIEDMNKRLQEISARRARYSIPVAVPSPATKLDPRLVDLDKEAAQIIGIERTRPELEAMLQSSSHVHGDAGVSGNSNKMVIVSVVGAGGLGKTTLAKAVYDVLSPKYDCGAFVSVGQKPDLIQVFTSIFYHLDQEKYKVIRDIKDLLLLIGELRKFLRNKRYFIVIDDVWDKESWEAIRSALPLDQESSGSRIIKTTRNREVACSDEVYYQLRPLTHDNSKKLFYMRLFGGEDKCPNNHPVELSDTILKKCGGVPLAIITMASLLLGKSREEWIEVCKSPGFYRDNKDKRQMENTMHILSLSYYDLPPHLKTCLLYLSVFAEDSLIDKDSLIWMWIAEGFVEKKPGRRLFEVGEEYFHDLINRSMIQRVDSKVYGIISGCRVHDMVLDLIVSMSREENFVSVDGTLSQSHTRRLALNNRELDLTQDTCEKLPQVKSFIVWQCAIVKWTFLHPRFKLIRVLALEHCTFREGCDNLELIGNLLHLRYLGIRRSRIEELLGGIGPLKFLQTLDLESTHAALELPCSIGMLTQLVCLRAPDITVPDGVIGRLTSLEELQIRVPHLIERQFVKDLGNLCELRVIKFSVHSEFDESSMQTNLIQSLGKLQKMQHLTLCRLYRIVDMDMNAWDAAVPSRDLRCLFLHDIKFPMLPSWIKSAHLPSLSHLEIHVNDIDEQGVKALGRLPELCYLNLFTSSTATIACNNTKADGCFQKLRSLVLPGSMVQFVANEDSTASFTIGPAVSRVVPAIGRKRKRDDSRVVPTVVVMPTIEELQFTVDVKKLMQNNGVSCEDLGLEYLPSIRRVEVTLWCRGAFEDDVEREEAALRHAIHVHPNCPALQIQYFGKGAMKSRPDDDDAVQPRNEENEETTVVARAS